ncbi:unnamed protein product [Microthlaspi erraticum]|uniref:Uncharacterized protein n=1 Tax=Microthlaspi erraticum TaxID=1685480 RepID=A0A6D2JD37_9BRAS|nr:unnamed protein product [Microthlaspi erraticum]
MGRNCVGPIVCQHHLMGESEAVDKHCDWIILSKNGRIKWSYTAASRTDQSNGAIQMLNQGVSGQSGHDTQQMREGANRRSHSFHEDRIKEEMLIFNGPITFSYPAA